MKVVTAQENDSAFLKDPKDPNQRQKNETSWIRTNVSSANEPGVLLHSTMVSVTEGGFDPPTFGLHLAGYVPNAIPLCYSVYAPLGGTTFVNGKPLESIFIFNIFLNKMFVFFDTKIEPVGTWEGKSPPLHQCNQCNPLCQPSLLSSSPCLLHLCQRVLLLLCRPWRRCRASSAPSKKS